MLERRAMSWAAGLALLATTIGGCADELGPETLPRTRVEGTIRLGGLPLTSGWVEFLPVEATRGNLRSAPIGNDGSYAVDGVPVGRVAVGLAGVHGRPISTPLGPVGFWVFRGSQTPLRRTTAAGSSRIDLDLAAEAEACQRRRFDAAEPSDGPRG
jgi:hypothetical protein